MNFLDNHITDIRKLCFDHSVKQLYAFGSVLTHEFDIKSDIDFVVNFDSMDIALYADNYYNLKFSLQHVLNRSVDLLEEKAIKNPYFKQSLSIC